ncbi:MAG: hypothetical protein J5863_03210, partial [Desulfovibrio sp.]|nr:hypothetical protein [Desulfovibrio sp.]
MALACSGSLRWKRPALPALPHNAGGLPDALSGACGRPEGNQAGFGPLLQDFELLDVDLRTFSEA